MSLFDALYSGLPAFVSCAPCLSRSSNLQINGRNLKILRLLGEGGFSYVYLVQDNKTGSLAALKKIRCAFGQESVSRAIYEAEAYDLFKDAPNIIHSEDHIVVTDHADSGTKTVYILLPYYQKGNLQDLINSNLISNESLSEPAFLDLMIGLAQALQFMHGDSSRTLDQPVLPTVDCLSDRIVRCDSPRTIAEERAKRRIESPEIETDPLMPTLQPRTLHAEGAIGSYSHRDIKPGNVMLADNGVDPVLMDFGSLAPSPITVTSRSVGLEIQDLAAEHSTMPYRAPELFDVKTGSVIDTKTDVWSFGCTMFACLVGKSPFEMRSEETGGSLSLAILGGDWRFPDETAPGAQSSNRGYNVISAPIKTVIRSCLELEPQHRPSIGTVLQLLQNVRALPLETSPRSAEDR